MAQTRTGQFPIGFRLGSYGSTWQEDLSAVVAFCVEEGFESIDGVSDPDEIKQATSAGLRIGEGALPGKGRMVSADAAERKDAAQSRAEHIRKVVPLGVRNFCLTISPTNPQEPDRSATFKFAVDSYGQLCSLIEDTGAHIVLEPYPGKQPRYANLGCTPESLRSLFKEIGSDVMGINLDPSHLIWTGIDTVRFVHEFADRIYHIHAKDTQILDDNLYDCGNLQDHTYPTNENYGGRNWRYALPGHGVARWEKYFEILEERGYKGVVSIEHEDWRFYGSDELNKTALRAGRDFLKYV